ncbi:nuclear transport factor 2 family protein [Kitasatospora sp. NPDC056531]|uniref:nuclear transport factor 2 family protein n=1 Tax=Kitasatospora sp. NPDC056531 TaxID=3345856 RepID=UPI0036C6ECF4
MTNSTQERIGRLEEQLRDLTDRSLIGALIDRFVSGLDHPNPQWCDETWYRSLFSEDIVLDMPNGTHRGIAGMPDFFGGPKTQWARTHHMTTNHLIEVAGDMATGRANVQATHVPHGPDAPLFVGGARYDFEAVRTATGWRISRLATAIVWLNDGTGSIATAAR